MRLSDISLILNEDETALTQLILHEEKVYNLLLEIIRYSNAYASLPAIVSDIFSDTSDHTSLSFLLRLCSDLGDWKSFLSAYDTALNTTTYAIPIISELNTDKDLVMYSNGSTDYVHWLCYWQTEYRLAQSLSSISPAPSETFIPIKKREELATTYESLSFD